MIGWFSINFLFEYVEFGGIFLIKFQGGKKTEPDSQRTNLACRLV